MLWLQPPRYLSLSQAEALEANQNSLVTMHDVGRTVKQLAHVGPGGVCDDGCASRLPAGTFEELLYGRSLLEPIPRARTCGEAGISPDCCVTNGIRDARLSDSQVDVLAARMIAALNARIKPQSELCHALPEPPAWKVRATMVLPEFSNQDAIRLTLELKYDPSNGVCPDPLSFSGVFRTEAAGEPDPATLARVSKYAHEPCIHRLEKRFWQFCLCRDGNVVR